MYEVMDNLHSDKISSDDVFEGLVSVGEATQRVLKRLNLRPASSEEKSKFEEEEARNKIKALNYLKVIFPYADKQAFFTDYTGQTYDEVIDFWAVAQAAEIDAVCASCKGTCSLSDSLKARSSRPVISVAQSARGFSYLDVRWTCNFPCKFPLSSSKFTQLLRKSGLTKSQIKQTFETYICTSPENRNAKNKALVAAKEGTCLIVMGESCTGKTHLATAIAIEVMKSGIQAIYRTASELINELMCKDKEDNDDFLEFLRLKKELKSIPCLVLDNFCMENANNNRGMNYLYEIIYERDICKLQTVITTNAINLHELESWGNGFSIPGIVSRISGRGNWVVLKREQVFDTEVGLCR